MGQQMSDGQRGVAQRLQRLVSEGREVNQAHAPVLVLPLRRTAAVNPDLVPRVDQPGADFLDRGFKTAIPGWNTSCPDHGDVHATPPRLNVLHTIAEAS
ncbi:hypothetical protein Mth01_13340 [Sphaerimonospora thailandensis]|uniref:Uncharacterized protein n=1 Tax=Sphaerimonospora thailandensis TaxID=795644 RepID=A0A8J3R783_9ACTN|nr:hypothetical protein Mth01_13340 [Sphaerimonospora thailandensis]